MVEALDVVSEGEDEGRYLGGAFCSPAQPPCAWRSSAHPDLLFRRLREGHYQDSLESSSSRPRAVQAP
jgi:hypothetical protein